MIQPATTLDEAYALMREVQARTAAGTRLTSREWRYFWQAFAKTTAAEARRAA